MKETSKNRKRQEKENNNIKYTTRPDKKPRGRPNDIQRLNDTKKETTIYRKTKKKMRLTGKRERNEGNDKNIRKRQEKENNNRKYGETR